ncbi:MAG: peptidase S10 [Clostridia bacterium]|nr:peptidase S10 [Clostridia bacterium]
MKRMMTLLLSLCLLAGMMSLVFAEEAKAAREDHLVVTHHTAVIQGKEIAYTVTAGTMAMDNELGQYDLFFTAYTMDGLENPAERPITFAWNGGPGVASMFVNLGFMGPERMDLDGNGMLKQVPSGTIPNDYSLLDLTDLVFVDPVGTGFSRAAGNTDPKVFYHYDNDFTSIGEFIRVYVNRNGRWASPKYIAGESYGTVRNAGVARYLQDEAHMNLNGIMMISTANNFATLEFTPGNELPFVTFFPTYAATAWYHKKAAEHFLAMSLEDFMKEARTFAEETYQPALFRGSRLTVEERRDLAEKMAGYIGLSPEDIEGQNLRVTNDFFCSHLLKDRKLMAGRVDSRYTGPVVSGSLEDGDADPSMTGMTEAFVGAFNEVLTRKLNYQTNLRYEAMSNEVNGKWDQSHFTNSMLSQESMIHDCMSKNTFMKVWVVCGYYDLATPFFAAEWTYSHLFLNEDIRKNLSFTYYPAGHMFYLHEPSLKQFRQDAEAWFGGNR